MSQHGFLRRHGVKLVASVVITAGIVYTLTRGGMKFIPDGGDFKNVRWWTIPVYIVLCAGMNYFRAIRWRYLLRGFADVPTRRILSVSWIGFAAILMMPFRIGEIVRPYLIREKGKVSLTAATGSVVAERIFDGLYLSLVLAIALITVPTLNPLPDHVIGLPSVVSVRTVRSSAFAVLYLFVVAFSTIAVFYFARDFATRFTRATVGRVSQKLSDKLTGLFEKFADGLQFLSRGADARGFIFETTIYWGMNALGMWLLAWGCGVVHQDGSAITFGEACALMGMLGVTILIPGPPGLIGVFQAGIFSGMTMYFPAHIVTGTGSAYTFIMFVIQVLWTILAGAFFAITDKGTMRGIREAEGIDSPREPTQNVS